MSVSSHHVGRFQLSLPADAELIDLDVEVDGVACSELDVGDPSPDGGAIAWYQISDSMRTAPDFKEDLGDGLYAGTSAETVLMLRHVGERGLELSGALGLRDVASGLADLYGDSAGGRQVFALRWGHLDITAPRIEELAATYRGVGWELELGSCPLLATSDSEFEDYRELLVDEGYEVVVERRALDGLDAEMIVLVRDGSYIAKWRSAGVADSNVEPEIEVTFTSTLPADVAAGVWASISAGLEFVRPAP